MTKAIVVHKATAERWEDFVTLMGPKGGSGGCWCMLWRLDRKSYDEEDGDGRLAAMRNIFDQGRMPGLLAYKDGIPVGWCSVAPRTDFPRLASSRILKPVDDANVWSVSCFHVVKAYRRQGISVSLLLATVNFVKKQGGTIIEGYPVDPTKDNYPAVYAWIGLASAYRKAGFVEVARRSPTRPIMRKMISNE